MSGHPNNRTSTSSALSYEQQKEHAAVLAYIEKDMRAMKEADDARKAASTSKSPTGQEAHRAAKEVECGKAWEMVGNEGEDEEWENITAEEVNDAK